MSQAFDSTDYASRDASVPPRTGGTIAGWLYLNSLPGTEHGVFMLSVSNASSLAGLRWNGSALRAHNDAAGSNAPSNPTAGDWYYVFLRWDATDVEAGWKTIAQTDFTGRKWSISPVASGTASRLRVGGNDFYPNSLDMRAFRLAAWDERVSDANLLLAAATDLGYTTNINTHLPLTQGIGSPWNDTSGNGRNWTTSGTFSDQADPSLSVGHPTTKRLAGVPFASSNRGVW